MQKPEMIPLKEIKKRKDLQVRLNGVNQEVVDQYVIAIEEGEEFPPLVVYWVNGEYVLVDGYHRHAAYQKAGAETVKVVVNEGTFTEALDYARFEANRKNGQRLTRADLWALLDAVLADPRHSSKSDQVLARLCYCSAPAVAAARRRTGVVVTERVGADGVVRQVRDLDEPLTPLNDGDPPAGPKAPQDGGEGVLTVLLLERLQDHVSDLQVSAEKLEGRVSTRELNAALVALGDAVRCLQSEAVRHNEPVEQTK